MSCRRPLNALSPKHLLLALAALSCLGTFRPLPAAGADDEIKLGMVRPESGPDAPEGPSLVKAAELAVRQINQQGGIKGKKLTLVFADNKSSGEGGAQAIRKLAEDPKIVAIVGPLKSAHIVGMSPTIQSSRIPTIIGGTNPRLTQGDNQWMFRCRPDDTVSAYGVVKYLRDFTDYRRVGILHENDVFGTGGADYLTKYANELGITVVKRVAYAKTQKDEEIAASINSIKADGAQALILYSATPGKAGEIERLYAGMGKPFALLIGSPMTAAKLAVENAKDAANGLYSVVDIALGSSDESKAFLDAYRKEWHENPNTIDTFVYDGTMMLANAIRKGGESRERIRDEMRRTKDYKGVLGTYSFNARGDGLHEVSIVKLADGKQTLVKVIKQKTD